MKKKLAFLLAIVMVLALVFVGCDKGNSGKDDTDTKTTTKPISTEEAVVGEWTATVDFTDALISSMGELGEMGDYFTFKDFDLKFIVELKADKTYTLSLDEDVTKESLETIVDQMMDGMEDYMNDMLEESGAEMTFEELLESEGMTMDEYRETLKEGFDIDELDLTSKGKYTVDGDKVVLSEDGADETTTFTYDDGELVFEDITSGDADDEAVEMMKDALDGATFKKK